MTRLIGLIVLLGTLPYIAAVRAADAAKVGRFELFEIELAADAQAGNPYVELSADATLSPPAGAASRMIPLFWDGGKKWKLRFSPDAVGTWKWSVKSRYLGLNGKSGTVEVGDSSGTGSIRPMKGFPTHFERQDGKPFWFMGDTAWALYYDNAEEKYDRTQALAYIDARAARGFNVLHSSLLSELGWGNSGGMPFEDIAAEKINPAYWQEVDVRLAHANKQGVVCGLALAWGDKKKTEPFAWRRFPSLEARKRYARYIAARYSGYNMYFLVSGEWHAEIRTRGSDEPTIKKEFIEIGDALHAADPHNRMIGIHPMTSHGSVREFVGAAKWMTFGDYQQNYKDLHARILESRKTNQPLINSEYGYHLRDQSGDGVPDKDNSTSLEAIRNATWDICMAGGYVVTGFGTTYLGGGRDPGPFDLHASRNKPWEEQIGHIKSIFCQTQWWKLEPHDELLTCETPRGKDTRELNHIAPPTETYWCLAEPGQQYLVYCRGLKSPFSVAIDAKPGQLTASQVNPRTGERRVLGGASGRFEIRPPDDKDWVIHISRPADRTERGGKGRIQYLSYRSELNGQDIPIMVYTPPGYEAGNERYPVAYNLHGAGGGNPARQWDRIRSTLTDAMDNGKARPVVYVFVNGLGDTFFIDSANKSLLIDSSITRELIPFIDKYYRTIADRSGRAVDGFSMGGFGCLMLALKHPELFSAVCSYGAALISAERAGFGEGKRFASREHFDQFNPRTLVEKNADSIRRDLKIRLVCGDADGLYPANVEFTKLLEKLSIPISWISVPGVGHDTKGLYQRVGLDSLKFIEAAQDAARPKR
jgi:enterochelin esterase-like enzyme